MTLTPAIKLTYAYPIAVKPAVGFSSLNRLHRAPAPSNLLGAFFISAPEGFPYGGVRGETFGSAGLSASGHRSANPTYAVTILISSEWCRFGVNQIETTSMSTPLFVPRGDISPAECHDYIRIYAFQAQALTQLVSNTFSNCRAGEDYSDTQDQLGWALWALNDLLRAQIALCERLEGGGFTTVDRAR